MWDAGSGEQLTRLVGHTKPVHVLEGHPSMHGFAMSASYDGQIIVWDLDAAIQLSRHAHCLPVITRKAAGGSCWLEMWIYIALAQSLGKT